MPPPPDKYTRPQTPPMAAHIRRTQCYPSPDSSLEHDYPRQRRQTISVARLVAQLEQRVSRAEKKFSWIATAFDVQQPQLQSMCSPDASRLAVKQPMPAAVGPFSLSTLFYQLESPDSSGSTAQDTSADLSLYGWLSVQGAQTMTAPPARGPMRRLHLATLGSSERIDSKQQNDVLPLSPPPTSEFPSSAHFGAPGPAAVLRTDKDAHIATKRNARVEKPLPALPISPPASPLVPRIAQFEDADELEEAILFQSSLHESDSSETQAGFDLEHALSRNLALQHASAAVVRQYKLVVQELQLRVLARPSRPATNPHRTVRFAPTPLRANSSPGQITVEVADGLAKMCKEQNSHDGRAGSAQDNSAREFAVLLSREASEEEMDAEHLRTLAARLEDIARQRRLLATSVLRC